MELTIVQKIVVWSLPVLFAITVHEVAHGWAAKKLGDPTAMMLGRLTLNPVKHIDPIGTILVPLVLIIIQSPYVLGWAKPVPVTWENLRHPKRDMTLVALAGPTSNLFMAILWALIAKLGFFIGAQPGSPGFPLVLMGQAGIFINLILMFLNLLPIPPLDGGRVLVGLLPGRLSWQVSRIEPYGMLILLALLFTGALGYILSPPLFALMRLLYNIAGL